jgi:hypothetical protein
MTATQATKQLLDMGCVFLSIVDIEGSTIIPKQQKQIHHPCRYKEAGGQDQYLPKDSS